MRGTVLAEYKYNPATNKFLGILELVVFVPMGLGVIYLAGETGTEFYLYLGGALVLFGLLLAWMVFGANSRNKRLAIVVTTDTVTTTYKNQTRTFEFDQISEITAPGKGKQSLIVIPKNGSRMIFPEPKNGHEVAGAFFAAKMEKIRATMTPAEWENYKLQLENNRLLQKLNKRGSSSSSGYSVSYTQEID